MMFFNPLFLQVINNQESAAPLKNAKLNGSSYLFSDIMKVCIDKNDSTGAGLITADNKNTMKLPGALSQAVQPSVQLNSGNMLLNLLQQNTLPALLPDEKSIILPKTAPLAEAQNSQVDSLVFNKSEIYDFVSRLLNKNDIKGKISVILDNAGTESKQLLDQLKQGEVTPELLLSLLKQGNTISIENTDAQKSQGLLIRLVEELQTKGTLGSDQEIKKIHANSSDEVAKKEKDSNAEEVNIADDKGAFVYSIGYSQMGEAAAEPDAGLNELPENATYKLELSLFDYEQNPGNQSTAVFNELSKIKPVPDLFAFDGTDHSFKLNDVSVLSNSDILKNSAATAMADESFGLQAVPAIDSEVVQINSVEASKLTTGQSVEQSSENGVPQGTVNKPVIASENEKINLPINNLIGNSDNQDLSDQTTALDVGKIVVENTPLKMQSEKQPAFIQTQTTETGLNVPISGAKLAEPEKDIQAGKENIKPEANTLTEKKTVAQEAVRSAINTNEIKPQTAAYLNTDKTEAKNKTNSQPGKVSSQMQAEQPEASKVLKQSGNHADHVILSDQQSEVKAGKISAAVQNDLSSKATLSTKENTAKPAPVQGENYFNKEYEKEGVSETEPKSEFLSKASENNAGSSTIADTKVSPKIFNINGSKLNIVESEVHFTSTGSKILSDSKPDTLKSAPTILQPAGDSVPAEIKQVITSAVEKSAEKKAAEAKPIEVKPIEVKPIEVKPIEVKPIEVKPTEVKAAEIKPDVENIVSRHIPGAEKKQQGLPEKELTESTVPELGKMKTDPSREVSMSGKPEEEVIKADASENVISEYKLSKISRVKSDNKLKTKTSGVNQENFGVKGSAPTESKIVDRNKNKVENKAELNTPADEQKNTTIKPSESSAVKHSAEANVPVSDSDVKASQIIAGENTSQKSGLSGERIDGKANTSDNSTDQNKQNQEQQSAQDHGTAKGKIQETHNIGGIEAKGTDLNIKEKQTVDLPQNATATRTIKAAEVVKEISKFIQQSENRTMIIKVDPENLGSVKIALEIVNKAVHASIEVENESARKMVENNLNQLYQSLNQNGVQLSSLNISLANYEQKQGKNFTARRKSSGFEGESAAEDKIDAENKNMGYNTYEYLI